jgi:hypothetical protein
MSKHWDEVPPSVMEEMRAQAKECDWAETEESGETVSEFVDSMTDEQVLAHYENQPGGIDEFCRASGLETSGLE